MAQSVDVNALFDRIALLVTGGVSSGPIVTTRLDAIELAATDNRIVIKSNVNRIQNIENQLDINTANEPVDSTQFIITTNSPLWDSGLTPPTRDPYNMWDGILETTVGFTMDVPEPEGIVFIEFDTGAIVSVGGFIMRFHPDSYRTPQDIVLFSGTSDANGPTGPWTQLGTSEGISFNQGVLTVAFPSQSARFFRAVFSNPAGGVINPEEALLMNWSAFVLTKGV